MSIWLSFIDFVEWQLKIHRFEGVSFLCAIHFSVVQMLPVVNAFLVCVCLCVYRIEFISSFVVAALFGVFSTHLYAYSLK